MQKVKYTSCNEKIVAVYEGTNDHVRLITKLNEGSILENNAYVVYISKKILRPILAQYRSRKD